MAEKAQVQRLKRSVAEWNEWCMAQPDDFCPNLRGADLEGADLGSADLFSADLSYANLSYTNLNSTDFREADLSNANLSNANLNNVNLHDANLSHTNLSSANLNNACFRHLIFDSADLSAIFSYTTFAWVDLSNAQGLEAARHVGPSSVDISTVILPRDERTRLHFLRGIGFTETQIEHLPSFLTPRSIRYPSLFIGYASQDETLAKRLYTDLRKKNVPCWFAPHDLRPGTPILRGIEQAIHRSDKFLLILSKYAVSSAWIEREVDAALHQEIKRGTDVLFPIRLDNAILESNAGWATRLQHRHIGDFTNWQDDTAYQEAFSTLLRHLEVSKPPVQ
jgi:hypothetical protein